MAKIAQVSSKYIIHSNISIEGVVDRPDVIGAVFGQTEGLLGEDLELREMQKSGRIGRIEVNTETKNGKTVGEIIIPSSLDKAETAIVAAALEIIQRIGPCNAKIQVTKIEDIRISKRKQVVERAKQLLKNLVDSTTPDTQEIADEVAYSVRVAEIQDYGKDKLPAGPAIDESDDIIVVEGRADVLNLLKYGFKNAVAVGGTGVKRTIADLCKEKTVTVFVDGDRGGDLIVKELQNITEIDFVTKAPSGKEVEELTKKEIHKSLRAKVSIEQVHLEDKEGVQGKNHSSSSQSSSSSASNNQRKSQQRSQSNRKQSDNTQKGGRSSPNSQSQQAAKTNSGALSDDEKEKFNKMLEDLIGTRGAYILDKSLNVLGKIPISELESTIKSLNNAAYAIIFDGSVSKELLTTSEKSNVKYLIGMSSKVKTNGKTKVYTPEQLA
ncbi:MAG: DNA primase DnaG [Candidatus Woesearchaeota archaeon]